MREREREREKRKRREKRKERKKNTYSIIHLVGGRSQKFIPI